jgi:hypothetical protein
MVLLLFLPASIRRSDSERLPLKVSIANGLHGVIGASRMKEAAETHYVLKVAGALEVAGASKGWRPDTL